MNKTKSWQEIFQETVARVRKERTDNQCLPRFLKLPDESGKIPPDQMKQILESLNNVKIK